MLMTVCGSVFFYFYKPNTNCCNIAIDFINAHAFGIRVWVICIEQIWQHLDSYSGQAEITRDYIFRGPSSTTDIEHLVRSAASKQGAGRNKCPLLSALTYK